MHSEQEQSKSVTEIIDGWKDQIIDLSRRNNLIDFQETKTKSLPLEGKPPSMLAESFVGDTTIQLRQETSEDTDLSQTEVRTERASDAAADSLSEIKRYHRQYLRERGVDTLFLAVGSLRWFADSQDDDQLQSPLFLVPVNLKRNPTAGPRYHDFEIEYTQDPIQINPALRKKLYDCRGVSLPDSSEIHLDALDDGLESIREIADAFDQWCVSEETTLCIFDFANISIYEDIERNRETIATDPHVRAIAGDHDGLDLIKERDGKTRSKSTRSPAVQLGDAKGEDGASQAEGSQNNTTYQVLEADPTQRNAIDAAIAGESFVLQGPPGTGKSQTIANIIAEKLGRGERVLFVSEKQAALDVVKSRLEDVGIGRFCLEVHGQQATKSAVRNSLEAELHADQIQLPADIESIHSQRDGTQTELDEYADLLFSSPDGFEITAYEALGTVARLSDVPTVDPELSDLLQHEQAAVDDAIRELEQLATYTDPIQHFQSHPWRPTKIDDWRVDTRESLEQCLDEQIDVLEQLQSLAQDLTEKTAISLEQVADVERSIAALEQLAFAPKNYWSPDLLDRKFYGRESETKRFVDANVRISKLERHLDDRYEQSILQEDGGALHRDLSQFGLSRYVRPRYYQLKRQLASHTLNGYDPSFSDLLEDARKLRSLQELREEVREGEIPERFIEPFREGSTVDWEQMQAVQEWLAMFVDHEVVSVTEETTITTGDLAVVADLHETLTQLQDELSSVSGKFEKMMAVEQIDIDGTKFADAPISDRISYLNFLRNNINRLQDWLQFKQRRSAVQDTIADAYVTNFLAEGYDPSDLVDSFRRAVRRSLLNAMYEQTSLSSFHREEYQRYLSKYREYDKALLKYSSIAVQHAVTSHRPELELKHASSAGQVILKREIKKQSHRRPLRDLFADASDTIQDLKPCFMMSPRTVAQCLKQGEINFDVVIFDEASQIPPAKAVSSLIRAEQVIVAGDSKQLPPTTFFETDIEHSRDRRPDLESILDEATAVLPERRLTWHYRSQSAELIEFSNSRYYDNRLTTFPAASTNDKALRYVYVEDGVYDRGGSRINDVEATRVVDLIEAHAEDSPEKSLGVVAFSRAQERAIRETLQQRRKANGVLDSFVEQENIQEEFFIKNLEMVQGDERDKIIFSVGYGPDEDGEVTMNFGPLNQTGGERRLNVAVTRARQAITVVASLKPEEIDTSRTDSRGVKDFKRYLSYVREQDQDRQSNTGREWGQRINRNDPFVDAVATTLTEAGYEVDRQLTSSGYTLDIGVRDPNNPTEYIIGIECDGSAHAQTETSRERDRLRQQVLAEKGWSIHRVWAPNWATNPDGSLDRIIEHISELQTGGDRADEQLVPAPRPQEPISAEQDEAASVFEVYEPPTLSEISHADDISEQHIQQWLLEVVAQAGPISETVTYRYLAECLGNDRLRSEIRESLESLSEKIAEGGYLRISDGFLWPPAEHYSLPVREHSDERRSIDEIAIPEIAKACYLLLESGGRMTRSDLVLETARRFGYERTGSRIDTRINKAIDRLQSIDAVGTDGEFICSRSELDIDTRLKTTIYEMSNSSHN